MQSLQNAMFSSLKLLSAGAPGLAAMLSEDLMFRTRRRPLRETERELLARADRLVLTSEYGELPVWRWGSGPTVLLVHGWNGHGAQLGGFVDPLVRAGYQVVAFDAPGHGAAPGARSSMLHFADAIETVVDSVRPVLGPLHALVAHSMGGPASVLAMSRYQARAPLGLERELRETELPVKRFVLVAPPTDVSDFIRTFSRVADVGEHTERLLRERIERRFGVTIDALYAPGLVRRFAAPALVIHDVDDREVPVARGRELASAWPGAELVETRGLGHARILGDPAVIRRVVDFVDVLPAA